MIKRALTPDSYELHSKQDLYPQKSNKSALPEWVLQLKNLQQINFWKKFAWAQAMCIFSLMNLMILVYLLVIVSEQKADIQAQKNSGRQMRQELKAFHVKLEKLQTQASKNSQAVLGSNSSESGSSDDEEFSIMAPIHYWGTIKAGRSHQALIQIDDQSSLFKLGQRIGEHYSIQHFDQERLVLESKNGQQRIVLMEQPQ